MSTLCKIQAEVQGEDKMKVRQGKMWSKATWHIAISANAAPKWTAKTHGSLQAPLESLQSDDLRVVRRSQGRGETCLLVCFPSPVGGPLVRAHTPPSELNPPAYLGYISKPSAPSQETIFHAPQQGAYPSSEKPNWWGEGAIVPLRETERKKEKESRDS